MVSGLVPLHHTFSWGCCLQLFGHIRRFAGWVDPATPCSCSWAVCWEGQWPESCWSFSWCSKGFINSQWWTCPAVWWLGAWFRHFKIACVCDTVIHRFKVIADRLGPSKTASWDSTVFTCSHLSRFETVNRSKTDDFYCGVASRPRSADFRNTNQPSASTLLNNPHEKGLVFNEFPSRNGSVWPEFQGVMDSKRAWCGKKDDTSPWYQMDLGEVKEVAGVVLASRHVLSAALTPVATRFCWTWEGTLNGGADAAQWVTTQALLVMGMLVAQSLSVSSRRLPGSKSLLLIWRQNRPNRPFAGYPTLIQVDYEGNPLIWGFRYASKVCQNVLTNVLTSSYIISIYTRQSCTNFMPFQSIGCQLVKRIFRFQVCVSQLQDGPWKLADDGREFSGSESEPISLRPSSIPFVISWFQNGCFSKHARSEKSCGCCSFLRSIPHKAK